MTVPRAAIIASGVRDVRAARLRRRVCQAADRAERTGPERPASPSMIRAGLVGERTGTQVGTRQRRPNIAAHPGGPFELQ